MADATEGFVWRLARIFRLASVDHGSVSVCRFWLIVSCGCGGSPDVVSVVAGSTAGNAVQGVGRACSYPGAGSSRRLLMPSCSSRVQGPCRARWMVVCRPWRAMRPAAENSRSRSRLGSQRRAALAG